MIDIHRFRIKAGLVRKLIICQKFNIVGDKMTTQNASNSAVPEIHASVSFSKGHNFLSMFLTKGDRI